MNLVYLFFPRRLSTNKDKMIFLKLFMYRSKIAIRGHNGVSTLKNARVKTFFIIFFKTIDVVSNYW